MEESSLVVISQDALNDASPGDVIEIPAGEHYIDLRTAVRHAKQSPEL